MTDGEVMVLLQRFFGWVSGHGKLVLTVTVCWCLVASAAILGYSFSMGGLYRQEQQEQQELTAGWLVTEDGEVTATDATLPYRLVSRETKVVELTGSVPVTSFQNGVLFTVIYHNELEVLIDGESVYKSVFEPGLWEKFTPGSLKVAVMLPDNSEGKELCLRYTRVVKNDGTDIKPVYLSPAIAVPPDVFRSGISFFVVTTLCLMGVAMALAAIFYEPATSLRNPLFYLSLFVATTGLWVLCFSKYMQFFTTNGVFIHNLEYITFYTFPIFMWAFLLTNWKRSARIVEVAVYSHLALLAIALTCKLFGLLDFSSFLHLYRTVLLVSISGFLVYSSINWRKHDFAMRTFFLGFASLAATAAVDVIRIYFLDRSGISAMVVGLVIMGGCVAASYIISTRVRMRDRIENSVYKAMAYTDKLTGMNNRQAFERDVELLGKNVSQYRSIVFVNLDVNRFKEINDNYGHVMGDGVLRKVANEIKRSVSGVATCYRMGGDEFCLIATNQEALKLKHLLEKLNNSLYSVIDEIPVSISYGVAEYNRFLHHDLMAVFKDADDIMYSYKKARR